jgi:Peptidyl-prolyl cis-trans isomerase (rotamase) - cyclophilin family
MIKSGVPMTIRLAALLSLAVCLPGTAWCQNLVRFQTNLGDIDVNLLPGSAPKTVANFLNYVNRGAYNGSIIHRSVPGFIIQGGGYKLVNHDLAAIPEDATVPNEFSVSNTRGTIAMAKLGGDANSATNQWFFNLSNNGSNLDSTNGGYTVFGRIANQAGLAVMDKIAAVPNYAVSAFYSNLPLQNYTGGPIQDSNFVLINAITLVDTIPAISENGIITASTFGGFTAAAPGSFIEIYGKNLAGTTRQWGSADFVDGNAPTVLDGVSVTVNDRPAYVFSVSPGQVNVQIPSDVPTGAPVPVVVSYKGQNSAPVMLAINPVQGGIFAPPSFNIDGKQFVAAVHPATGAFVNAAAPAAPGKPWCCMESDSGR